MASSPVIPTFSPVSSGYGPGPGLARRLLRSLLIFLLAGASLPSADAGISDGFIYTQQDGNIEITGYIGPSKPVQTVPEKILNQPVRSITARAFAQFSRSVFQINLPATIAILENGVFDGLADLETIQLAPGNTSFIIEGGILYNQSRTRLLWLASARTGTLTFPDSVTSLDFGALKACRNLSAFEVGTGNTAFSSVEGVLLNKAATSILRCPGKRRGEYRIPISVTGIFEYAFDGCRGLTGIQIPHGVEALGGQAFRGCVGLTHLFLPASMSYLGSRPFEGCRNLAEIRVDPENQAFSSDYGVLIDKPGKSLLHCPEGKAGDYIVPPNISSITRFAFGSCVRLTRVTLPSGITTVSEFAFYGCRELLEVDLPAGLLKIDTAAFSGCTSLTGIELPASLTDIGASVFAGCAGLAAIELPESLQSIGSRAFEGCTGLRSIRLPDTVSSLGTGVLSRCSLLESVTLPARLQTLPSYTLGGCSLLTQVTIPSGVTSIENNAFSSCQNLTSIFVPASVTSIDPTAFLSCPLPEGVTVDPRNPAYFSVDGTLFDKSGETLLLLPGSLTGYTIPEGVTVCGPNAFSSASSLTVLWIPKTVTSLGSILPLCTGLLSITADPANTAYSTGDGVLYNKSRDTLLRYPAASPATAFAIPQSVTTIGGYAFYGASQLRELTIPDSVVSIGSSAFAHCSALTSIAFPPELTAIPDSACWDCSRLATVTLGNKVTRIQSVAFQDCGSLATILLPESLAELGYRAFKNCSALSTITIPASVTVLGYAAFAGCTSLTGIEVPPENATYDSRDGVVFEKQSSVLRQYPPGGPKNYTVPEGVLRLAESAFEGCAELISIRLPDGLKGLPQLAFAGCHSLVSVNIPRSVTTINASFIQCRSLARITIPASVQSLETAAFSGCESLRRVYFEGDVPGTENPRSFVGTDAATLYRSPAATGWHSEFAGRPVVMWTPQISTVSGGGDAFRILTGADGHPVFSLTITGQPGEEGTVEAATGWANSGQDWEKIGSFMLPAQGPAGWAAQEFLDPDARLYPSRFYRLSMP